MKTISIEGFEKPNSVSAGLAPRLQWLPIANLVVDPRYQGPIAGKGRRTVNRIARVFSWTCFAPVIVAPTEDDKYAIIDGRHRTTAAALAGFTSVPCQIVSATREEQVAAAQAINGTATPISRMALHAAAKGASDPLAVKLAEICTRAEVELLRYPVSIERQSAGQTMAIGALTQCLRRYGEETLITALQCVTQTTNNRPGVLSAQVIKALCQVLDCDRQRREGGLALLEAFDSIDLIALQRTSARHAGVHKISALQALADLIRSDLGRRLPACKKPDAVEPPHPLMGMRGGASTKAPWRMQKD